MTSTDRNATPQPAASSRGEHWAAQPERGSLILMRLTAWAAKNLGRGVTAPVLWVIVLYFFVFSRKARDSIAQYQQRLTATTGRSDLFPKRFPIYRQFLAFADVLLDKLAVWQGRIGRAHVDVIDPYGLNEGMATGRGQIVVVAHLGNLEVCRALADRYTGVKLNVLVHSKHAERFNQLLADSGSDSLRLLQVTELDAAVMLDLSRRVDRGEWLAIAADRVPVSGTRVVPVTFLGEQAELPQGPWLLGGMLKCPVNMLFCIKLNRKYRITLERLADAIEWSRSTRTAVITDWAQRYADRLAQECADAPLQWFNFFPFWKHHARSRHS